MTAERPARPGRTRTRSSLLIRFAALVAVFLIVPAALYLRFQAADAEKNALLADIIEKQGDVITSALRPIVLEKGQAGILDISERVNALGEESQTNLKLLLHPAGDTDGSFFFVAAWPGVDTDLLERERNALLRTGILDNARRSCAVGSGGTSRYTNAQGLEELIASVNTVRTADGCWVIVTSYSDGSVFDSSLARSYWSSPEIQLAAAVYLLMAGVVVWMFADIWLNLRRFERVAASLASGPGRARSFKRLNRIRELDRIAATFDDMVDTLKRSADEIRRSAEENAHTFKAPIAVIRQSTDLLRHAVAKDPQKAERPLEIIDTSLDKLDALVGAARELDKSTADSLEITRAPVHLAPLLRAIADGFRGQLEATGRHISVDIAADAVVTGDAELIETALENLIENAAGFSPENATVRVALRSGAGTATITVSDDGPGIPDDKIDAVFERYVSIRPDGGSASPNNPAHFGIGLWIARRNMRSLGGSITLANRANGGLDARITLPTAS